MHIDISLAKLISNMHGEIRTATVKIMAFVDTA